MKERRRKNENSSSNNNKIKRYTSISNFSCILNVEKFSVFFYTKVKLLFQAFLISSLVFFFSFPHIYHNVIRIWCFVLWPPSRQPHTTLVIFFYFLSQYLFFISKYKKPNIKSILYSFFGVFWWQVKKKMHFRQVIELKWLFGQQHFDLRWFLFCSYSFFKIECIALDFRFAIYLFV